MNIAIQILTFLILICLRLSGLSVSVQRLDFINHMVINGTTCFFPCRFLEMFFQSILYWCHVGADTFNSLAETGPKILLGLPEVYVTSNSRQLLSCWYGDVNVSTCLLYMFSAFYFSVSSISFLQLQD